jgi:hypothetical protein
MTETAQLLAVVSMGVLLLTGIVLLFLRRAPASEHEHELRNWQQMVSGLPQHSDLRVMGDRLAAMERAVEGMRAEIGGVKDAILRTERMTNIIIEQKLEREK